MAKHAIFDKKNILVVGGAGFVGSHLCDELVEGNKVICVDNFLTGAEIHIAHLLQDPNFKFINHDIINPIDLEHYPSLEKFKIEFQGVQEIYFLASPASPSAYSQYPIETLTVNSIGLKNCLDLAVKYKAKFIYTSSAAVYGEVMGDELISESDIGRVDQLGKRACFAEAKRFGETLVNNYRLKYDLDTKIVRIFNCYGPRMELDDGRMVPEMIKAAISNKDILIYGDKNSADTLFYVDDLIRALIKAMESAENGPINLGSEWRSNFSEIAEKIIKITKSKSKIKYVKKSDLMITQPLPDISLAKEKLGWFPIILLDEGLKKTADYLSAQVNILEPEKLVE